MLLTTILSAGCTAPIDGELVQHTIDATSYDQVYTLTVFEPSDTSGSLDVVYLFDGDDWTERTAGIVTALARDALRAPPLVVGIGYGELRNQRGRDYTPPGDDIPEGHGEVEAFYAFVEQDLVPWVDATWSTNDTAEGRTLMGHSFGGIASLWGLFTAPDTFGNIVALSPSLAFAEAAFFVIEDDYATDHDGLPADVYLAAGSQEAHALAGLTDAFGARLADRGYPDLRIRTDIIAGRFHASLFPDGAERGLAFVREQ